MSISSLLNLKISNLKKKNDIHESVGEDDGEPKSQPSSEKKTSFHNGSQWQRKISNRLLILILFPFLSTVHFMQIDTLGWAAIERGWVWGGEKVMAMAFLFAIPN